MSCRRRFHSLSAQTAAHHHAAERGLERELALGEGEVKEEGAGQRADRRRSEPAEQSVPRHLVPAHDKTEVLGRTHQKTINPAEIDG